ncbi:tetratricopeptide repeat protein [Odoribacter lunatus]|uniref:tetratricopeptide repeat protein n=1 Tax=Odoribacter lunatus TaxID=2941335 RepID=UPI00203EED11|nr:tetratricopeptide repeat protein [Odoribacter lunatus]
MRYTLVIIGLLVWILPAAAQQERKLIREGNKLYEGQGFEKAEVEYRKALDKKADSFEAAFNLGDALYKQEKYDEALRQFAALAEKTTDKERLGQLYHNIGNTLLSMQKTDESIEAYKESLRNRPSSEETKYNLEFARQRKQQEQQNQNQDNKDNKDNKDNQNQDKQNQNQDKNQDQNKDNKEQDKQDQNKQDQDKQNNQDQDKNQQNQDKQERDKGQQQPQEQQGKISKEDAQRLLEALQNDEKKVQEKVRKEKVQQQKAKKQKIEKDW